MPLTTEPQSSARIVSPLDKLNRMVLMFLKGQYRQGVLSVLGSRATHSLMMS
jgi:hypothetical protein